MQQLDKKAFWLFLFGSGNSVASGIIIFPLLVFGLINVAPILAAEGTNIVWGDYIAWIVLAVIAIIICIVIWAKLSYSSYKYELTELGFRKESGVIWKSYVTIPYERIQNVDIRRGLLTRILGLSDIQIQTAGASFGNGSGGAEGALPGIAKEAAETLRDELIRRSIGSKHQAV